MVMNRKTTSIYIGLLITAMLLVSYLVLRYSLVQQPDISNISHTNEDVNDHFEHCEFESIRSDIDDNLYLVITDREHNSTYVLEMNRSGKRISAFCYPYVGALFVYITPEKGELVFNRTRAGITHLFSNTGELIIETTIAELGLDYDLVNQDPNDISLSDGMQVSIMQVKGKYQLIATQQDGTSVILIKQADESKFN